MLTDGRRISRIINLCELRAFDGSTAQLKRSEKRNDEVKRTTSSAKQNLSKLQPRLFLFHAPMSNQIVEDFACIRAQTRNVCRHPKYEPPLAYSITIYMVESVSITS